MKKSLLRRVASSFGLVVSMFGLTVLPAVAQNSSQSGNGFRISPVRVEYSIEKGRTETMSLTLENPSDAPTTAHPIVNDFVASDKEDGEPRLILDENASAPKNSFKSLVQTLPDIQLGPREKKDISVPIKVPEDANAGGYYGAVRFAPVVDAAGSGNVGLTASVGTIVLIRVPGNLTERLDLVQLSAAQKGKAKSFFMSGDVSVLTRLKNEGDIHVKPFGKVVVKNIFGKTVQQIEFNADDGKNERANILPTSTRRFENELSKHKYLGRYTIEANLGYSQGSGDLISAKTTFWYMPLWSIIVLLLLIGALAAGVYFFVHRMQQRKKH